VHGLNDTRWVDDFEVPFAGKELNMPFFTVLGDDDWQGNFTAQALKGNEVYENFDGPKWTFPNYWYHYVQHFRDSSATTSTFAGADVSVGFVFVDTKILNDDFAWANVTKLAWDDLRSSLSIASRIFDWVVVVGHQPLISSGSSKGSYFLSQTLKPLLKEFNVDAYISGKDHDLEILEDGALGLLNCGAGGSGDPIKLRVRNEHSVALHTGAGFCLHTLTAKEFKTELIDGYSGDVVETFSLLKKNRERSYMDRFNLYKKMPPVVYIPISDSPLAPLPMEDPFVRVVGTIGLFIAASFSLLSVVVGAKSVVA